MLLGLVTWSSTLEAQTVRADRFTFNTGPCVLRSGSGTPEGVVLGNVCDTFWRTDTGQIYTKTSGTGNTGWTTFGISGSGTPNTLPLWTASTTLGDSFIRQSSNDIVTDPSGNDILPATGYDINIGALTNKYLALHAAELWVETLVAQSTMATIGGRILVAPTTLLTSDLTVIATSINVKHNNLASGDRVYLEANGQVEFLAITSTAFGSGPYSYNVTRNLDGTGANAWTAGDAVLNTGTTGNGFIDLYSVRGVKAGTEIGPTIVFNQRLSSTYNDWAPRVALGNLDGLYGYSGSTYGSAFGTPSGSRVTIDPTNGIRMYDGLNNQRVSITPAGDALFSGSVTVGSGRNVIRNSECRVGTDDWTHAPDTTGLTGSIGTLTGAGLAGETSICFGSLTGTPAISTASYLHNSQKLLVVPGLRYEFYTYIAKTSTGMAVTPYIAFYQSNGTFISSSVGNTVATACTGSATLDSTWCFAGAIVTAPALASYGQMSVQTAHPGGHNNPTTYIVRQYFGQAQTDQTDYTEWGPAGLTEIIGGLIKTDTIDARTIAADTITASEIAANAITTSELNADSVTSAKIVAGTIVASDIATDTITANEIAANAITTTEIAANTIVAGDIAAGTITGTEIAATTITASNLNVSTLSAITANMGTLTAGSITGGTIDGATIRAGTGDEVTLDGSGITLTGGTGTNNRIKWTGGHEMWGTTGGIFFNGNVSIEDVLVVGGEGSSAIDLSVTDLGVGDQIQFTNMPISTGTDVIWENACGCLKKVSSSSRYKENIKPWQMSNAQRLLNLTPISFDYRGVGAKNVVGFSAEEVYLVAPEAVNLDKDGRPDSLRQDAINAYLLQIIKELRAEIEQLKSSR